VETEGPLMRRFTPHILTFLLVVLLLCVSLTQSLHSREFLIDTGGIDDNAVIDAFRNLGDDLSGMLQEGPAADRPARAMFGSFYFETDSDNRLFWYAGEVWGWLQVHTDLSTGEFSWQPDDANAIVYSDANRYLKANTDYLRTALAGGQKGLVIYGAGMPTDATTGIGATSRQLRLLNEGDYAIVMATAFSDTAAHRPIVWLDRARGSDATQAPVLSGDGLSQIRTSGWYDDTNTANAATTSVEAAENWSGTNQGARVKHSVRRTGATTLDEICRLEDQQLLLSQDGTESKVSLAWLTDTGTGFFLNATDNIGVAMNLIRRYQLGYRFFLSEYDYAGTAYWQIDNASTNAAATSLLQIMTSSANDSLLRFQTNDANWWAFGQDYSNSDKLVWAAGSYLGSTDRMRLDRNGVAWLYPHATSLTTDGELAADGTNKAFRQYIGSTNSRITSVQATPLSSDTTVNTSSGDYGPANAASVTISSDLMVAGNVFKVVAAGVSAIRNITNPPPDGDATIGLRIESTDIVEKTFITPPTYTDENYITWMFEAYLTVRSSTSLEVTLAKMTYDDGAQAIAPWPFKGRTATMILGGHDGNVTTSGNVTIGIRWEATDCNPDDFSYLTIRKLNVGLEHT
jgi:hypothetical protein